LNQLLGTRGSVWAERYHARALTTPRAVRNALVYVLFNHRQHGRRALVDPRSSARFHDGWVGERLVARGARDEPVVPGKTWLMTQGWKRLGLLGRRERPAGAR